MWSDGLCMAAEDSLSSPSDKTMAPSPMCCGVLTLNNNKQTKMHDGTALQQEVSVEIQLSKE